MSKLLTFDEVIQHFQTLNQYIPIVTRVHGGHHPEMHQVQEHFIKMFEKVNEAGQDIPDIKEELEQLRLITDNYKIPGDVCESYEAVYRLLSEIDQAYQTEFERQ